MPRTVSEKVKNRILELFKKITLNFYHLKREE